MRLQESRNASLSKTSVAILLGLVKADSQSEDNGAFLSDRFSDKTGHHYEYRCFRNDCFRDTAAVRSTYGVL